MTTAGAQTGTASSTGTLPRGLEVPADLGKTRLGSWPCAAGASWRRQGVDGTVSRTVLHEPSLPSAAGSGRRRAGPDASIAARARRPIPRRQPPRPAQWPLCLPAQDYDFPCVHARQRSKVRRGLEMFTIRPVEESELLRQGLQLNTDTMVRQGRYDPEFGEPARWERLVKAVYGSSRWSPTAHS